MFPLFSFLINCIDLKKSRAELKQKPKKTLGCIETSMLVIVGFLRLFAIWTCVRKLFLAFTYSLSLIGFHVLGWVGVISCCAPIALLLVWGSPDNLCRGVLLVVLLPGFIWRPLAPHPRLCSFLLWFTPLFGCCVLRFCLLCFFAGFALTEVHVKPPELPTARIAAFHRPAEERLRSRTTAKVQAQAPFDHMHLTPRAFHYVCFPGHLHCRFHLRLQRFGCLDSSFRMFVCP